MTRSTVIRALRRLLIVAVLAVILVRPTWGTVEVETERADLDVVFVIDRTRSMIAEDGPGGRTRLDLVKQDLQVLAHELAGARLAAITFGGDVVRTELPFTTDTNAFTALVDTLAVEGPYDGVGSLLDRPVEETLSVLRSDAEQYPDRRRLVILLSDGENTARSGEQTSFGPLRDFADSGGVLGYGTEKGAPMRVDENDPEDGYLTDTEGEEAVSRVDTANLNRVAGELGVTFVHRTTDRPAPLRNLAASFEAMQVDTESTQARGRELTWLFGLALLPLLLWELWSARRTVREVRRFSS